MDTLKNCIATAKYQGESEKTAYEKRMKKYEPLRYLLTGVVGISETGAPFGYARVWMKNPILNVKAGNIVKISCSFKSSIASNVKLLR